MVFAVRPWFALSVLAAMPLYAQLTYSGCPGALTASDFEAVELFNRTGSPSGTPSDPQLSEPTRMDVRVVNKPDGTWDHTDIILVERAGNVKWYDGMEKKVTQIGHIDVHATPGSQDDNGLMGVAFHPDFGKNRWIYLWYSPKQTFNQAMTGSGSNRQLRLSRFTLKSDNTLDMTSEKSLLKILGSKSDWWHSGGPMTFDAYGDLWIGVGNNGPDLDPNGCSNGGSVLSKTDSTQSQEWGSSNTASMRGGFLRIHPDSSEKGYGIPPGNFGEYWADKFEQQGKSALAAEYRNSAKVAPEVYVKGERSNFSIAVHPTKRWLAWGTVNWDKNDDEFNLATHPIFSGYPYFHGNNKPTCAHGKSAAAPLNESPLNSGVKELPPAVPGTINSLINVAIGGPIYSFDPANPNPFKFPPHFDNKWLVAGFGAQGAPWNLWATTFDVTQEPPRILDTTSLKDGIFKNVPIRNFVGATFGKDGALYILNYSGYYGSAVNPGVVRVTYKGQCQVVSAARPRPAAPYAKIWFEQRGITIGAEGPHRAELFDLEGRRVWSASGTGPHSYGLDAIGARTRLPPGVYQAKVRTASGEYTGRISAF